jgi:hypothetical protein
MTVSFELGPEFFERRDVPLSVDDLRYGFERGWLRAATVIDLAVHEVERGSDEPLLLEVASLLRDDVDDLPDVLAQLDSPDHIHDPRESARKWLYLELQAAYDQREDLDDPLGVVKQVYADFDYPPSVEDFVRYMPLRPGDEAGEAALIERWGQFLRSERDALGVGTPRR